MANENCAELMKAAQQRTNAKLIGLLKKYTPTKSRLEQPQFKLKEHVPGCFNPFESGTILSLKLSYALYTEPLADPASWLCSCHEQYVFELLG